MIPVLLTRELSFRFLLPLSPITNLASERIGFEPGCAILFSFDTDPCRRVKACRRIELGGETSGGPSRPP